MCNSPRTGCAQRITPIYTYVARTSNNRVIMACDLCCCLLPQCEALRTCRSGFPIATVHGICSWTSKLDVTVWKLLERQLATNCTATLLLMEHIHQWLTLTEVHALGNEGQVSLYNYEQKLRISKIPARSD